LTGTIPQRQYELEREIDMMINLTPIEVQEENCNGKTNQASLAVRHMHNERQLVSEMNLD